MKTYKCIECGAVFWHPWNLKCPERGGILREVSGD